MEAICDDHGLPIDAEKGYDMFEVARSTENLVRSYFERGEDDLIVDLQTVHMAMPEKMSRDFHKQPPATFTITSILIGQYDHTRAFQRIFHKRERSHPGGGQQYTERSVWKGSFGPSLPDYP